MNIKYWIWLISCLILATLSIVIILKLHSLHNKIIESQLPKIHIDKDSIPSKAIKDSSQDFKKNAARIIDIICSDSKKGQSNKLLNINEIEQDLLKCYHKIYEWEFKKYIDNQDDSIAKANLDFRKKLQYYTSTYPQTLKYHFNLLKSDRQVEGLNIATSPDGKFRIYSWDIGRGGSMRYFDNIIQFQSDKLCSECINADYEGDSDNGGSYSDVFEVNSGVMTFYLGRINKVNFGTDYVQGVKCFSIDHGNLNDSIQLLEIDGELTNQYLTEFNPFSVYRSDEQRPTTLNIIRIKDYGKTIKIPFVDSVGRVTHKFDTYKFNGMYFVKSKN